MVDPERKMPVTHWNVPAGTIVEGDLDLSNYPQLRALPEKLTVTGRLVLDGCLELHTLPRGLCCYELSACGSGLRSVPEDIRVTYRIDLSDCKQLEELPSGLKVSVLLVQGCTALEKLPEASDIFFLDMTRCVGISRFPQQGRERMGRLIARECTALRELPDWLRGIGQLDVSGCRMLRTLPEHLQITGWLDVADTILTTRPEAMRDVTLCWHSVRINERIAFRPWEIQADEVLKERNAELRRVLLERMGHERFIEQAQPEVLHSDRDAGGARRLLRIAMGNDEPLCLLAVQCPSTDRQYTLRVPPTIQTCHQAAAWIAGFDNPDDYHPIAES
jgi:hypothetical protein